MKKKRLIETLPTLEIMDLVKQSWMPVKKFARIQKITNASVYNRIKRGRLEAANFEGRVFVKIKE